MKRRRQFGLAFLLLLVALATTAQYRDRQTWAERDEWQRPDEVLDQLQVKPGSVVADVGAGEGYFTVKLAERVGASGTVYAEDIDPAAVANLRKLAQDRGLKQVTVIEGTADDPHLPGAKLDAILVVNAYHEFRRHDAMLAAFLKGLKPGGLVGIIDKAAELESGQPREIYERQHRMPESFLKEDLQRAGFADIHDERGFDGVGGRAGEHWWFVMAKRP